MKSLYSIPEAIVIPINPRYSSDLGNDIERWAANRRWELHNHQDSSYRDHEIPFTMRRFNGSTVDLFLPAEYDMNFLNNGKLKTIKVGSYRTENTGKGGISDLSLTLRLKPSTLLVVDPKGLEKIAENYRL